MAKYSGYRFSSMQSAELLINAGQLMVKIGVVTGWMIPDDEMEQSILREQFALKLREAYASCTHDEVMYAIRNYGTQVKDWGKQFNLSLLDEVMVPYLAERSRVSGLEADLAAKTSQKTLKAPEMTLEDWVKWLQTSAEGVKSGYLPVRLLPVALYDWAEKTGRIALTAAQKREFVTHAVGMRKKELEENAQNDPSISNRKALNEFTDQAMAGEFVGPEAELLKSLAKKCALFMYLKTYQNA